MDSVLNILVLGLTRGVLYALLVLGFALIFSVGRVINLAHGAYFMIGAYFSYVVSGLVLGAQTNLWVVVVAVLAGAVVGGLFALFQFYVLMRSLKTAKHDYILVVSLALSLFASEVFRQLFGVSRAVPQPLAHGFSNIGSVRVMNQELVIMPIAAVTIGAMLLYLKYTKQGRSILAVAQNREAAVLMGIDPTKVLAIVFFLAGFTAALAGALMGPIRVVDPLMWISPLIAAFAIVVMGGLGSLYGPIAAAFLLAITETAAGLEIGARYTELVGFVLIVVILALRPAGLLGKQVKL